MDDVAPLAGPTGAVVDRTDAELIEAFVAAGREEAFAELVRRHGPMVMGVCRRHLGNRQDAEDAFQVTFLVLAKNAGNIRNRHMLGSWLFGVARRVALKAQSAGARRRSAQTRLIQMLTTTRPDSDPPNELLAFLDEEIDRLPSQYRAAIVTCYLEGKTNREAAKILGWPEGTLVTRLNRAKESLRSKAAAKGMTLSVTAIGAALTQHFSPAADVGSALVATTAKAAAAHAAGHSLATVVSAKTLSLLHETGRMLFWAKVKLITAVVLGVIMLGTGAAVVGHILMSGRGDVSSFDLKSAMPRVENGSADVALLKSVQKMRSAAFAMARSGSGVAQDDGAYDGLGSDRTVPDRRGVVRFAFTANRFLTRVEFPEEPGVVLGYAGVGNRVLAYRNLPPEEPVAQIGMQKGSTLDHKPVDWSVAQISRISPWANDDEFFAYLLAGDRSEVEWRISREGSIVRLAIDNHHGGVYAERIRNSKMLVEFDMEHHAMTSLFRFERESSEEIRGTELQRHRITWRSTGDADVPVERHVTLALKQGDVVKVRSSSFVRFQDYSLGSVRDSVVNADLLGIPEGAQVVDETEQSVSTHPWKAGSFR